MVYSSHTKCQLFRLNIKWSSHFQMWMSSNWFVQVLAMTVIPAFCTITFSISPHICLLFATCKRSTSINNMQLIIQSLKQNTFVYPLWWHIEENVVGLEFIPAQRAYMVEMYIDTKCLKVMKWRFQKQFRNRNPPIVGTIWYNYLKYSRHGTNWYRNIVHIRSPCSTRSH